MRRQLSTIRSTFRTGLIAACLSRLSAPNTDSRPGGDFRWLSISLPDNDSHLIEFTYRSVLLARPTKASQKTSNNRDCTAATHSCEDRFKRHCGIITNEP